MNFLCPKHRMELIQLSEDKISDRWLEWMTKAAHLYQEKDWRKAASFAGCAMDLTSSALLRQDVNSRNLATHATLASIYTINLLQHQREVKSAEIFCDVFCQRMQIATYATDAEDWAKSCIKIVNNPEAYETFFNDYLAFPFEKAPAFTATSCASALH